MDTQTIRILEFNRVQDILKRYAQSPLGQSEIDSLTIQHDPVQIEYLLNCAAEMKSLVKERGRPSLQRVSDIRPFLKEVHIQGSLLQPGALISVWNVLRAAQGLKRFMKKECGAFPLLQAEIGRIEPLFELVEAIEKCIDENGEVRDSASDDLAGIRRRIREQKEAIKQRLDAILSSERLKTVVQERLVTVRNNRYVIPLRPDFSSKIQGIIHDQSASGMTVFVEPSETVKMNNHLSCLASEESKEIHRILLEISDLVRASEESLRQDVSVLAHVDLHLSKALFAEDYRAVIPRILSEKKIELKGARHPLLLEKKPGAGKEIVPIDLEVGESYRTLMITGPNMGGKTVALKTLGLLVLMAQAGIPIPAAEGSSMGIFRDVFADIGDEQSIQEEMSTFSSHIRNIVRILEHAGPESLVVLDELGTGTDPREGAALGIAILEALSLKGALTAATTHYEEIKQFAYTTRGMMNASVAYDTELLRPAYTLRYGHLGTSHAFEISERIGMPREVLDRARENIPDLDRSTTHLIEELEQKIRDNETVRHELERNKEEMQRALSAMAKEKEKTLKQAYQVLNETMSMADRAKVRSRRLLKIAEQGNRMRFEEEVKKIDQELKPANPLLSPSEPVDLERIQPGLEVEIMGTGKKGMVVSGPDKKKRVQVFCNGLRVQVSVHQLQHVSQGRPKERPVVTMEAEAFSREEVCPSINLIGLRVEEAVEKTGRYLDHAHLGNLRTVKIIHGIGTGALRDAIAKTLRAHPFVADFRSGHMEEGGPGVTLVELVS
ncbi:MAG: endonuclease MutS2 [bacterium]